MVYHGFMTQTFDHAVVCRFIKRGLLQTLDPYWVRIQAVFYYHSVRLPRNLITLIFNASLKGVMV